ncbi:MAG: laccase domain protein [Phycisphaerae bacterium]|nr:MAG: laccase domain-containing protein [Planctomycetia bacterium]GJQ27516.1 MAG: laccase domain protein [Phycisphaerae bacterium]
MSHPFQTVELLETPLDDGLLLQFEALCNIDDFRHSITTRPWNMAPHRGPQADLAVPRRRRVCEHLGFSFDRLTAPDQIHSPHVLRVLPGDVGRGRTERETAIPFTDGLICDLAGVPVMQFSADCPIVVLVDPVRRAFGTAHASWRGTVAGITSELVRQMQREFGVEPARLMGAICPCAGPGEYEVGEDVRRIAKARLEAGETFFSSRGGRLYFDLRAANVHQLVRAGVPVDRICVASASTMTDGRFYSHRRDGAETGRFAFIGGFV